jgi:HEAT repeat protein
MNSGLRTLGIAVLLATTVPAQAERRAAEPVSLQRLLTDLAAKDSRTWLAAMTQLVALGDRAVPALRQIVRRTGDQSADDAVRAVQVLQRIGVPAAVEIAKILL